MYLLTCFTVRKINKVEFFKCRDCRAIFSNSSRKDSNAQFAIVPLNPYSDIKKHARVRKKHVISALSSSLFLIRKKCAIYFCKNPQMKINILKEQKHGYLIHTWIRKAFKGTVVNRALPSLHRGSHEITFKCQLICLH